MFGDSACPTHARAPVESQPALPWQPVMIRPHVLSRQAGCQDENCLGSRAGRLYLDRSPPASTWSCFAAASSRLDIDQSLASERCLRASPRAGVSPTQSLPLTLLVQATEAICVDIDMAWSSVLEQCQGAGDFRRERSQPARDDDAMRE